MVALIQPLSRMTAPKNLTSMTGFARAAGAEPGLRWAWEIKSVNARGLDLRVRVPPGFDAVEAQARARLTKALARGTCYATLNVQRDAPAAAVRINHAVLASLIEAVRSVPPDATLRPASLDGLLGIRGVVETAEPLEDEAAQVSAQTAMLAGFDAAVSALNVMRRSEGAALHGVLSQRLTRLAEFTEAAETCPARKPEAVRARLVQTIETLTGAPSALDPQRLHQEAVLLAARSDIREEIDRLRAHIAAASELLRSGGPVGRRLDFLAQELAREANTLSAKSNDASLTAIGLDLKTEVEQLREQIQNIE